MTRFVDKALSSRIQGWPVEVAPMFSTQLAQVASGAEQANQRWIDPLRTISIPNGARDQVTFEALKAHWLVMSGPAKTWPWRDPTDFASKALTQVGVAPTTASTNQALGTGDGVTTQFQLYKSYDIGSPATPYRRPIYLPVVSSIQINDSTSPGIGWTVSRYGGVVTFAHPPGVGAVLTWGGLFDCLVRFADDDTFRGVFRTYAVSGFADIPLQEVRFCQD